MSAAGIVQFLAQQGHTVTVDGSDVVVRPAPAPHLIDQLRHRKLDLIAYLRELSVPPATGHRFVALQAVAADAERSSRACCIACGNVWKIHGEPPISAWRLVGNPDDVVLIEAAAIVVTAAAASVFEATQ